MIKCDYNYIIIIPFMLSTFSCTCCLFICLHWKNVFSIPLPVFNQIILFLFLLLSCMSSLYILDTNLLSVAWFANTFSRSMGCLLILWIVSLCACVCVCVLCRSFLFWCTPIVFAFAAFALVSNFKKDYCQHLVGMSLSELRELWWTGRPACCHSWGRKESDTTEQLNWTEC